MTLERGRKYAGMTVNLIVCEGSTVDASKICTHISLVVCNLSISPGSPPSPARGSSNTTLPIFSLRLEHRVDRVLGFFFSRPNWAPGPPTLSHTGECLPHPLWSRGGGSGNTRLGVEGPNSDEETDTVLL